MSTLSEFAQLPVLAEMSFQLKSIFTIVHVVGIILLFMGFAYGLKSWNKGAAIAHGLGLLIVLITGMGMVGSDFRPWVFVKLGVWLALGGALVLVKRKVLPESLNWIIIIALGALALWTVYYGRFTASFLQ
ncbi:hypothetical protein SAMN02745181_0700 [Rubritalea squalenifaciens DSM 18772]|uniref:Invasion gene expression up-regulator, SirB n=1 Tax=Rubritalea squalenifaciens DSM 18772 TaxID=1123071 RepID=A0A1M6DCF9_9BACT|nr:hypothetical protein [Rubritalea squalenifaciens]SHI70869.1 hypothetical protein SAMN02745181_0700 [Rubritalea squalenifaciens DSM 18772]